MGIRPGERHPSRIVSRTNNSLLFDLLENSKVTVDNVELVCECEDSSCDTNTADWDGVTYVHSLYGHRSDIQIRTYYNEEQEQYSILDYTVFILDDEGEVIDLKTIVKRGKTQEELDEQNAREVEPTDEHMAKIYQMFPDAQRS